MRDHLLTRRQFGKTAAGILVTFTLAPELAWPADAGPPGDLGKAPMLDAWLLIDQEGKVTIFTGKVELGQGILNVETVIVSHVEGSGCYGHNGADDVALDAALGPRRARPSGEGAVDARGRIRLGAFRLCDGDAGLCRTHR